MKYLLSLLALLTIVSCSTPEEDKALGSMQINQFEDIDFVNLQEQIEHRADIKNGVDIIRAYYPSDIDSNSGTSISYKIINKFFGKKYVLFKHENLNDPIMDAVAYYLVYDKSWTGDLNIIEFKKSYKCRSDMGTQEWSGQSCD